MFKGFDGFDMFKEFKSSNLYGPNYGFYIERDYCDNQLEYGMPREDDCESEHTCPIDDCAKTYDKLQAITYIVNNTTRNSEWAEAGAYSQISIIVNSKDGEKFSLSQLRAMVWL